MMNAPTEQETFVDSERVQGWNPLFCCCPQTPQSAALWGGVLVITGSVWLLSALGILSLLLNLIWPLVFIGVGLHFLRQAANAK